MNPFGFRTNNFFDASKRGISAQDALALVTTRCHHNVENWTVVQMARSFSTASLVDTPTRVQSTQKANEFVCSLIYAGNGRNKLVINRVGDPKRGADGSNLTTYTMDAKDRLTQDSTTGPNAHLYNYTYAANDNRLTANESGTLPSWTCDAANRMVTMLDVVARTTYTWVSRWNRIGVCDPSGPTTMAYDFKNRSSLTPSVLNLLFRTA